MVLPTLIDDLNISSASSTWPASAFSLTVASFLLIFGRTADIYGGYPVYVAGLVWLTIWSLIAGFSTNEIMLNFCRALQGLGPAAFLPSSVMILGSIYRPGPRKNVVFSIYGACAPLGFFAGIFFAGLTAEYTTWGVSLTIFYCSETMLFSNLFLVFIILPGRRARDVSHRPNTSLISESQLLPEHLKLSFCCTFETKD